MSENNNIHGFDFRGDAGYNDLSFGEKLKKVWDDDFPLFLRCFTLISLVLFIISFIKIFLGFIMALANIPLFTIQHFYLWSIFTSSFVNLSILNFIFGFLAFIPDAIVLERSNGTLKYMFTFFFHSFLIQILFIVLAYVISIVFSQITTIPSAGIWPMIIAQLTLKCLTNPDSKGNLFFIPIPIPAMFLPWALFLLFTVLNGFSVFQTDILAAILYGYLYFYLLMERLDKLVVSNEFLIKCENSICKPFTSFSGKYLSIY